MANHPSAEKRNRQTKKRTQVNRLHKTRVRSAIKDIYAMTNGGGKDGGEKKEELEQALKNATQLIDKAASVGVYHKKNAARKISRIHARANAVRST